MPKLISNFNLNERALGDITSAIQLGFISGTLVFAIFTIADRFSPSKIFFISAILAAIFNINILWSFNTYTSILALRFSTGFFLAGIYPIGMKIAADYYEKGLNKSLGFLVGALVLGTAFPHLMSNLMKSYPWKLVLINTSILASLGGSLMLVFVPNGPYRQPAKHMNISAFFSVFKPIDFRIAAFGYFGHMWELYTFWAFTPILLKTYTDLHPNITLNIPLLSFLIIGIGSISSILGGYISQYVGTQKTAFTTLLLSCICCLCVPLFLTISSEIVFIAFMLFWGFCVIADSPLFSTMIAKNASSKTKGTALTIVNCIGFSITIVSIQLMSWLHITFPSNTIYLILAIGPLFGLIHYHRNKLRPR